MTTKLLEIRDRATYIPVLATLMYSEDPKERYHLRRTGYSMDNPLVLITRLSDCKSQYGAYNWGTDSRTMREAHFYIQEHYNDLTSGDVVDVEYILHETKSITESEYGGW